MGAIHLPGFAKVDRPRTTPQRCLYRTVLPCGAVFLVPGLVALAHVVGAQHGVVGGWEPWYLGGGLALACHALDVRASAHRRSAIPRSTVLLTPLFGLRCPPSDRRGQLSVTAETPTVGALEESLSVVFHVAKLQVKHETMSKAVVFCYDNSIFYTKVPGM